jgi:hypothetical protein
MNYNQLTSSLNIPRCNRSFLNYVTSVCPIYDLDFLDTKIGTARVGKSMLNLVDLIEQLQFRFNFTEKQSIDHILKNEMLKNNFAYQQRQLNLFNTQVAAQQKSFFTFDDAIFAADRRNAMQRTSIELTEMLNGVADHNHVFNCLIQNIGDLDTRLTNKSNVLRLLDERGHGYVFSAPRNFASLLKDNYGFERIIKNPSLVSTPEKARHTLTGMSSFIFEINWKDIKHTELFGIYKGFKGASQSSNAYKQNRAFDIAEQIEKAIDVRKIAFNIEKTL